ncbi:hypothetical protein chiPu_0016956 [Chiloscyllium punctatum]|uniref:Uncharacterized protein n=1 Tax=Chiloscyllium punctatum TaxID=137246 RepID=A0A401T754_CHIPU|nr:hypothetical protein [Chiloscyllium punctatum]
MKSHVIDPNDTLMYLLQTEIGERNTTRIDFAGENAIISNVNVCRFTVNRFIPEDLIYLNGTWLNILVKKQTSGKQYWIKDKNILASSICEIIERRQI